ncbi:MAG: GAF domain-containing protein [Anaerolineales bacterium]|nr:GAF domain-containing protein [Anaerolineales bacterium]
MLKKFLSAPVFDDAEKTQAARLLHQVILANGAMPLLGILVAIINPASAQFVLPPSLVIAAFIGLSMALNYAGRVNLASGVLISINLLIFTFLNYLAAGEPRPLVLLGVISILMGGLLLGKRGVFITAIYLALQHIVIVALNLTGIISAKSPFQQSQNIIVTVVGDLLIAFIFYFAIHRLQLAADQFRNSERELKISNAELKDLTEGLERRVTDRTQALEAQERLALRRSRQFEGVTQVSKAINATRNLSELLPQITQVISERFGFYHVGIFLNDALNQYAVLSAANSSGGQTMLQRGHQLKIGAQGIVGYVTKSGTPRIALDVGADSVHFNNPYLPGTRSEMALPLKSGDEIIGALDIQSYESNAFSHEDIEALEALADQVSLAIQNTRLLDQTNRLLAESESLQRQYQKDTWSRLAREKKIGGYKYTITGATPLDEKEADQKPDEAKKEVHVPIALRGENIGSLVVHVPANEKVSADQMDLIKAVAERVALSAENARLFEETARRAEREQFISDIAAKISASVRTESILKTTAKELNQVLDGAEVVIKLGSDGNS